MRRIPKNLVSRKPLTALIALCLIVSAVAIPLGAHLPRFVELEIVFGVWWLVWVAVLASLLWSGHQIDGDSDVSKVSVARDFLRSCGDWLGDGCLLGCGDISLLIIAILFIVLSFLVLIEFVIPGVALLLLLSIGGMIARAVNDDRGCEGRFGLSLAWGAIWATLYTGPVAVIAFAVSIYLRQRGH